METLLQKIFDNLNDEEKQIVEAIDISKSVNDIVTDLENKGLVSFNNMSDDDQENQSN
jgi:hypothetical protein